MLRLTPEAMGRLFQSTMEKIKEAIGDVLNKPNVRGTNISFLCIMEQISLIINVACTRSIECQYRPLFRPYFIDLDWR